MSFRLSERDLLFPQNDPDILVVSKFPSGLLAPVIEWAGRMQFSELQRFCQRDVHVR